MIVVSGVFDESMLISRGLFLVDQRLLRASRVLGKRIVISG